MFHFINTELKPEQNISNPKLNVAVPEQGPRALPVFSEKERKEHTRTPGNFTKEVTSSGVSPVLCQDEGRRWGLSGTEVPASRHCWDSTCPVAASALLLLQLSLHFTEPTGKGPRRERRRGATEVR